MKIDKSTIVMIIATISLYVIESLLNNEVINETGAMLLIKIIMVGIPAIFLLHLLMYIFINKINHKKIQYSILGIKLIQFFGSLLFILLINYLYRR